MVGTAMNKEEMDAAGASAQAVVQSTRTWAPDTEPAPAEWATWFQRLTPVHATAVAHYLLLRMAAEDQCFVADHARQIRDLESTVGAVQAENRKLKARIVDDFGGLPIEQDQR